ncbi:hypothetical protein PV327_008157 [Microctonus hyperodae]|uniref:Uncharacterized protein n=1 Tax=Microctonus hyperodae TaxID=165561 RepID=A0AA39KGP0_MICHY|nr:hypothetical protein PV327_008157 [Microctonus hyperodae]
MALIKASPPNDSLMFVIRPPGVTSVMNLIQKHFQINILQYKLIFKRSADFKMSQKRMQVKHEWHFDYDTDHGYGRRVIPEVKMYSSVFESSSSFGMKFTLFCYLSKAGTSHVILSKAPDTPLHATIDIMCIKPHKSVRKTIDCWTDSCSLKIDLGSTLENVFHNSTRGSVAFQCDITWRIFQKPKPPVVNNPCDRFKNFLTAPDLSDMKIASETS